MTVTKEKRDEYKKNIRKTRKYMKEKRKKT
jgi:hypothetical protein